MSRCGIEYFIAGYHFGNAVVVDVCHYNIGGYTYYKLRDLARSTDVSVWYQKESDTVYIDTSRPYGNEQDAAALSVPNQNEPKDAVPTKSKIIINGERG